MSNEQPSLDELRAAIDGVDSEILALLWRRARLAAAVGERKQSGSGSPFYVPSREASIIRRLLEENQHQKSGRVQLPDAAVHGVFREIIGACLALEHPLTVAFLGPGGTFSHIAATRQFGATAEYHPCCSFGEIFNMVEAEQLSYGVVPVENSMEGAVTHVLDLFAECDSSVQICSEIQLEIHHQLFSYASSLDEIHQVVSHSQPLAQCRSWLESNLPQAELIESSSTVEGAERIVAARNRSSRHGDGSGAAAIDWRHAATIGSYSLVDYCDLNLLQRNIEDQRDNMTRFYVIGRHDSPPSGRDKTALI
ncbi:MAG: prephenate dehydratase domain-containing protein, partial [Mariprofundales bacterium]|nr:prephenate dehydratase domain-containing protein [Mariprofundales bacterium]